MKKSRKTRPAAPRTAPFGMLAARALKPATAVLLLWLVLAGVVYWDTPQSTPQDAVAIAYNSHPVLGLVLGAALAIGALNLLLSTSPLLRKITTVILMPFSAPWRRLPMYVRHQWTVLFRLILVVGVCLAILSVLRSGPTWAMLNAGIAEFPMHLPQYVIGGAIQLVIFVSSFLLLFAVLSRGGVTTLLPEDIRTNLDQVWGQDHVVERMREMIMFLKDPDVIEKAGGHVPGGVLLWGPPGTGKTLIAEAIAGETTVPFVLVEPGAFQNMFVGIGVLRVKALYRKLRRLSEVYGGVVVFFDEADVLGSRGGNAGGAETPRPVTATVQDKAVMPMMGGGDLGTLNAILSSMQGVQAPKGSWRKVRRAFGFPAAKPPKHRILHIMATNLPGALDPALLRPGRIDRMFHVGFPSREGREATLAGYIAKVENDLAPNQVAEFAAMTPNATGATIKDTVNEALISALRSGRTTVTFHDLMTARRLKELGPAEGVEYVPFERHAVAVHEASHAVIAWKERKHLSIDTVTIEKGQTYLGMVSSVPNEDLYTRWKSDYEADILVALAGAAGEKMLFGDSTSGVAGDLDAATRVARAMIGRWGMGATLAVPDGSSEHGQAQLDVAVEELLVTMMSRVEHLLADSRGLVLALAHALEIHRTMSGKDVEALLELRQGIDVDGTAYDSTAVREKLETYHAQMLACRLSRVAPTPDVTMVLETVEVTAGVWPGGPPDEEST